MANDAKNYIDLPELDRQDNGRPLKARLVLKTYKGLRPGLISSAHVEYVGNEFSTFELYGDYSRTLAANREARATQKAIDTQHSSVFTPDCVASITAEAREFYSAKTAKQALTA